MTPKEKVELAQRLLEEAIKETNCEEFAKKGPEHELVYAAMRSMTTEVEETADVLMKITQTLSYLPTTN